MSPLERRRLRLAARLAAASLLALSQGCAASSSAPKAAPASAPLAASSNAPRAEPETEPETVDDFALLDQAGQYHRLYANDDARAIVLVSYASDCSILRASVPRLEELAGAFAERGVRFFYVDASRHDDRAVLAAEARELGISAPILLDEAQLVLSALRVRRTAEAILVDPRDWHVAYRGAIDGRADGSGGTPVEHLDLALEAFLAEEAIAVPRTEPEGSVISYEDAHEPPPSYAAVLPILAEHCLPCHKAGGAAPWAMDSIERVRRWAPMMREAVRTKRMPPWHADPHVGTFSNDRSLALDEARALVRWIEAGSPRGDGPDELPALSAIPQPEWPLGEPDLVVEARRIDIPATGLVPYLFDTVKLDTTEDLWVRATDVQPSNSKILHHALIYVRYPKKPEDEPSESKGRNVFTWYRPGSSENVYPAGTGKRIPAGSKIVFELHYTATGKPESDSPRLGLYLLDAPPPLLLESTTAVPKDLRIPALDPHHVVIAKRNIPHDVLLHSMGPHMHLRGSAVDYRARYPDGTEETLLSVPRFDFNWQTSYRLAEPKLLPAGTTVVCRAVFDNSPRNPHNPDPTREVTWGEQTEDEMLIGLLEVHEVSAAPAPASTPLHEDSRGE